MTGINIENMIPDRKAPEFYIASRGYLGPVIERPEAEDVDVVVVVA